MDTWRYVRALLIGVGLGTGLGLFAGSAPFARAAATGRQQDQPASAGRVIRESGIVQPAEYVELCNQADQPLAILFIAPEGKAVKKGDVLVELDASALIDKRMQRVARQRKAEAELTVAKASLATAEHGASAAVEIAEKALQVAELQLKTFREGEYPIQLNAAQNEATMASERRLQAEARVQRLERNVDAGQDAQIDQLQEARFALAEARARLSAAESQLKLLNDFIRPQKTAEIELAVAQRQFDLARAKDAASEAAIRGRTAVALAETNYHTASVRLEKLDQQISSCKIYAPRDGRVVYPSDTFSDDAGKAVARPRPGAIVRNRQVVVRLADTSRLNVDVPVTLQVAQRVTTGQAATIRLDAIPARTVAGHIMEVGVRPEAPPGASEAFITVRIDDPAADLKPGMRATVEFDLSQAPKAQK